VLTVGQLVCGGQAKGVMAVWDSWWQFSAVSCVGRNGQNRGTCVLNGAGT